MAVMDRRPNSPPQKQYELVLTGYSGDKTRSAAIVILCHFCSITDSFASRCFDGLPEFKEVLIVSKDKSELLRIAASLGFYRIISEIREEVC